MIYFPNSVDDALNEVWLTIHAFCKGDEVTLNVTIPLIIMLVVYWSVGAFFSAVDMYGRPSWVLAFKIPDPNPTVYPRLTSEKLQQVVFRVFFNQTVVAIPVIYLCYLTRRSLGYDDGMRAPKLPLFLYNIAISILMEEILFYYFHRLLHHPLFYKKYHKKHHEWISPVGISAIYCHPVEHVLSNVLPTYAGSVIAGVHVTSLWCWMTFATAYGVIVHSGYHLPLTSTPEFHHYHHQKFNENFGITGFLDWLHGTDKNFRKSEAFARNKVLFALKPMP